MTVARRERSWLAVGRSIVTQAVGSFTHRAPPHITSSHLTSFTHDATRPHTHLIHRFMHSVAVFVGGCAVFISPFSSHTHVCHIRILQTVSKLITKFSSSSSLKRRCNHRGASKRNVWSGLLSGYVPGIIHSGHLHSCSEGREASQCVVLEQRT